MELYPSINSTCLREIRITELKMIAKIHPNSKLHSLVERSSLTSETLSVTCHLIPFLFVLKATCSPFNCLGTPYLKKSQAVGTKEASKEQNGHTCTIIGSTSARESDKIDDICGLSHALLNDFINRSQHERMLGKYHVNDSSYP